jgi:tetratricopeptide (TPR) repeat protein
MARAAVKAKQQAAKQQAKRGAQPSKAVSARRSGGRRKHAAGGNPNQQLFFMRLRRRAKFVYVLLAVLFAITFAFLGVGSGSSGLDQLFSNLNIFGGHGNSVSKAQSYVKKHPNEAKGYRDLATAYEAKGDTSGAITALQSYTRIKEQEAKAWTEMGGLQLTQAGDLSQQYQNAYTARQLAAPSTPFLPGGKLGQAVGQSPIEQAAAQQQDAVVTDLQQRTQLAYNNAVSSYDQAAQLQPNNPNAWFQLAQAGQTAGDVKTALKGYKRYLKLNPDSTSATQIKALIKQLSAGASG